MQDSDMRSIFIDCANVKSEEEFWRRYVDAAQPEGAGYFSCNLNAFWDAIEGGGPGWPGDVKVIFTNTAGLDSYFVDELRKIAQEASYTRVEVSSSVSRIIGPSANDPIADVQPDCRRATMAAIEGSV